MTLHIDVPSIDVQKLAPLVTSNIKLLAGWWTNIYAHIPNYVENRSYTIPTLRFIALD